MGDLFIKTLTDLIAVRSTASIYLPWLIITPLISVWCYLLDGIFIGADSTVRAQTVEHGPVNIITFNIEVHAISHTPFSFRYHYLEKSL